MKISIIINPEFAHTIAECKAQRAKVKNAEYKVNRIRKDVRFYSDLSRTDGIDPVKMQEVLNRLNAELQQAKLDLLNIKRESLS